MVPPKGMCVSAKAACREIAANAAPSLPPSLPLSLPSSSCLSPPSSLSPSPSPSPPPYPTTSPPFLNDRELRCRSGSLSRAGCPSGYASRRRKSTPTKPNQNQTKPNQTKPNQAKPNQTKPNQTEPNQTRPDQTTPKLDQTPTHKVERNSSGFTTPALDSAGYQPQKHSSNSTCKGHTS